MGDFSNVANESTIALIPNPFMSWHGGSWASDGPRPYNVNATTKVRKDLNDAKLIKAKAKRFYAPVRANEAR